MLVRINHAHSPSTHGRSFIPPTLQILLSLSPSFGTFQGPGVLDQAASILILRVCSVPDPYRFIIALVVHFSTPSLLFCFPCSAASRHFVRCLVDCRLLPIFFPITTLTSPIIHYQHLHYYLVVGHIPVSCACFPSYLTIDLHVFLYPSYHTLHFIFFLWRPFPLGFRFPQA